MTVVPVEFHGTRAVVTGGGRGIGLAIAERLVEIGASVVVNDLSAEALDEARDRLEARSRDGAVVLTCEGDAGDEETVRELIRRAERELGGIDIAVGNAGLVQPLLALDTPLDAWERTLRVNLTGPFLLAREAARSMRQADRGGRIVNIASIAGKRISVHGGAAYTASKAGLLGFTRHFAYECAPHGITVNAVCPGGVMTPGFDALASTRGSEKRLAQIPIGRFLTPRDVADAVVLLASAAAAGITGVALDVDGGSLLGWEPVGEYEAWMREWAGGANAIPPASGRS